VGQRASIDDHTVNTINAFLQPVDEGAFVVGLKKINIDSQGLSPLRNAPVYLIQSDDPVMVPVAATQSVEVGAMQD
jgi:hypothetical protein